jgi:hypothetical protein
VLLFCDCVRIRRRFDVADARHGHGGGVFRKDPPQTEGRHDAHPQIKTPPALKGGARPSACSARPATPPPHMKGGARPSGVQRAPRRHAAAHERGRLALWRAARAPPPRIPQDSQSLHKNLKKETCTNRSESACGCHFSLT